MGDDFGAHVEQLYAKKRTVATKVSPDFGSKDRPELVTLKRDDDLETVDPANVHDGGEISR